MEHLNGLGRKKWWAPTAAQGEQIRQRADAWEATVKDLKWSGSIPGRAWVGRSPQEWRSCVVDDPERLLQYAQEDLAVLRMARVIKVACSPLSHLGSYFLAYERF